MLTCLSHGGRNVYRTQAQSDELMVATIDGVVGLSRPDSKGEWRAGRRALEGKHISCLLIEPGREIFFAATHGDGLYASDDRGRTWTGKSRGLELPNIYSLNFAEAGGAFRLYAGTEPAHLFVSDDMGESWRELPSVRSVPSVDKWTFPGPPHVAHVKNITFDPRSSETIYLSIEVGGALKSVDGGQSWRELSGFYEDVHRIVIPAQQPEKVYIAGGDGIWHSPDGGESWEHLTDRSHRIAYPDALIAHPDDERLMFTAGAITSPGSWRKTQTADARIARSRDGGRSWQVLERGLPEHIRGNIEAMSMNVWPGGFSLFAGTTDGRIFFSADEGESWATIAHGLPPVSKAGHYRNLPRADAA
jgi:photosystem II stability/assembly factor-like uncharacterized protein